MAEINMPALSGTVKNIRKIGSTRVDLTPMVDLGFLLITFFILTTTWQQAGALKLFLPAGSDSKTTTGESLTLTIIPIDDQRIFYYHGKFEDINRSVQHGITGYNAKDGIGNIIREKKSVLRTSGKYKAGDMMLIIKPTEGASFGSIVSALDEVLINDLHHYAFVDISGPEVNWLKQNNLLH